MIKEKAKKYHNNILALPATTIDLKGFAEEILSEFIEELESSMRAADCNGEFTSVLRAEKLQEMKEKYLGNKDNQSTSVSEEGAGTRRA